MSSLPPTRMGMPRLGNCANYRNSFHFYSNKEWKLLQLYFLMIQGCCCWLSQDLPQSYWLKAPWGDVYQVQQSSPWSLLICSLGDNKKQERGTASASSTDHNPLHPPFQRITTYCIRFFSGSQPTRDWSLSRLYRSNYSVDLLSLTRKDKQIEQP